MYQVEWRAGLHPTNTPWQALFPAVPGDGFPILQTHSNLLERVYFRLGISSP
jgi:hypothetical protein